MTRYLADACAVIDFFRRGPSLGPSVSRIMSEQADLVAILSTTIWEMAIKARSGKLPDLPGWRLSWADALSERGFGILDFDAETAEHAAALPPVHADPFDRALIACAQRTGHTILTSDRVIPRYGVPVIW